MKAVSHQTFSDIERARRSKRMRKINLSFTKKKRCLNCTKEFVGRLKQKLCSEHCAKEWRLKRQYGIDFKMYNAIYEKQKGVCAICKRKKKLVIEHNHSTGKVRGLTCRYCNTVLNHVEKEGLFENIKKHLRTEYAIAK